MTKRIMVILILASCAGCLLPIPHRRVHAYGVKGQIVNASDHSPIKNALVRSDDQKYREARTDASGQFTLPPAYGWHGAYFIGPVNLSLLPGWDVTFPGSTFYVSASACHTQRFSVSSPNTPKDGPYLKAGVLRLSPMKQGTNELSSSWGGPPLNHPRQKQDDARRSRNLIVYEVKPTDPSGEPMTFRLRSTYGILIRRDLASPYPDRQRYELFAADRGRVIVTHSKDDFEEAISQLPLGSKVDYYDTCTTGLAMDDNARDDVLRYCDKIGKAGRYYLMCTCFGAVDERDWKWSQDSHRTTRNAP